MLMAQMQADITLDVLRAIVDGYPCCDEWTLIAAVELCAQIILNGEMAFNGLQTCTKAKVEKDVGLKLEEIYTKIFEFTKKWVNVTGLCNRIQYERTPNERPLQVLISAYHIIFTFFHCF